MNLISPTKNACRVKGVKRPSSRFSEPRAFCAGPPAKDAVRPTRDREAPVHIRQHTSVRPRLKPENAEFRPQSAFPHVMLQKGHETSRADRRRGKSQQLQSADNSCKTKRARRRRAPPRGESRARSPAPLARRRPAPRGEERAGPDGGSRGRGPRADALRQAGEGTARDWGLHGAAGASIVRGAFLFPSLFAARPGASNDAAV